MFERDAFVAEVAANLVHALDAADDAALQIQFEGNAQVHPRIHGVGLGSKRARGATTGDGLQDGCFDLDEASGVQIATDGSDDAAAG